MARNSWRAVSAEDTDDGGIANDTGEGGIATDRGADADAFDLMDDTNMEIPIDQQDEEPPEFLSDEQVVCAPSSFTTDAELATHTPLLSCEPYGLDDEIVDAILDIKLCAV